MPATTLGATYSILLDLDADGTPEHEIIADVESFEYWLRRDTPQSPHASGGATVTIANPRGTYSPWKGTSLANALKKRTIIDAKCTLSGTPYPLFRGRLRTPSPSTSELVTKIGCLDELTFQLSRREVTTSLVQRQTSKQLAGRVLDAIGWPGARHLRETRDRISFAWFTHQRGLSAMTEIAEAEGGFFFSGADGTAYYYDRHEPTSRAAAISSAFTIGDGDAAAYTDPVPDVDNIINSARITAQGRTIGPLTNIWQIPSFTLAPSQSRTIFTHHGSAATQIRSLTSGVDYKAVDAANSRSDLTANVAIDEQTMFAETGKIRVRNTHASKTIRVTVFRLRGRFIVDSHTVTKTATDSASIAANGENVYTLAPRLLSHSDAAQDRANMLVRHYKDARIRLSVTIESRTSALLTQILARGLHDRIQITNSYFGWTNEPFWILGKTGRIFPGRELHRMTWDLISVRASDYWKLGTTALNAAVVAG